MVEKTKDPTAAWQMKIRLSPALKEKVRSSAKRNRRTLNREIAARVQQSFEGDQAMALDERLARIEGASAKRK
jgi:hypothetical protein